MGGADTLVALEGPQFEWFIGKDKSYYVKSLPNGTKTEYWTRTPVGGTAAGVTITTSGNTANRTSNNYICPCICLPNTLAVGDYADGLKLLIQG